MDLHRIDHVYRWIGADRRDARLGLPEDPVCQSYTPLHDAIGVRRVHPSRARHQPGDVVVDMDFREGFRHRSRLRRRGEQHDRSVERDRCAGMDFRFDSYASDRLAVRLLCQKAPLAQSNLVVCEYYIQL